MHYRILATIITPGVIALAGLAAPGSLHAQVGLASESSSPQLDAAALQAALSTYRVVRWSSAAPVLHCSPAPISERPGVQAEFARPPVIPLEDAFADAQSVKRAIEYRARRLAMDDR